ncbi:MAG: glycosyltransferase family 39 protein [Candidatus Nomurabacteria bacterium]|nr:MAG: glycosyltransferase family 39 protein [Candidatus Nomurabacteria bacterium]
MRSKISNSVTRAKKLFSINRRNLLILFIAVLCIYGLVVKVVATTKLGYFADEPDDFAMFLNDFDQVDEFFSKASGADQARFPHVISAPILLALGDNPLIATRILYIIIHCIYLYVLYKLFRLSLSKVKSFYGIVLVASSAYLFSFSIFTMTTSNNLSLLLGTLMLYLYLSNFNTPSRTTINQFAIFGLVSGLAIGSRFFSAIILVSIFLYDAYINRQSLLKNNSYKFWGLPYEDLNIAFTLIIVLINLLPLPSVFKVFMACVLILYYVVYFIFEYFRRKADKTKLNFINKWIVIVHTAFVATLISSPIHLNFINIENIFKWSDIWHKVDNFINPSRSDIFTIIGFKTGLFAGIMMMCTLVIIVWRRQMKDFMKSYALFLLIILLHLLVFIQVKYVIAWYPLFIMPFFYLPLIYVLPDKPSDLKKPLMALLLVVLLLIPIHEQYRYWKLFPYGHIDGAQYGKQYIGWNKPGMITFESFDHIIGYLKDNRSTLPAGAIECNFVRSERFKEWAITIMNAFLEKESLSDYYCLPAVSTNDNPRYVITSIYTSDESIEAIRKNYTEEHVFTEASIPVVIFWVKK